MKKILLGISMCIVSGFAQETMQLAAGAGYKVPVMETINLFNNKDRKIEGVYGHLKQISAQIKSMDLPLAIGDQGFFEERSSEFDISGYENIGEGILVIAFGKGKNIKNINDLENEDIKKIAIPDPKKAIYGIRGQEFLKNTKLYDKVENKLIKTSTVPQAASYLISGEVDASIMNLTAAINLKEKIGGHIIVPQENYRKIQISAIKMKKCQSMKICQDYLEFLKSDEAKAVFTKFGL